MTLDPIAVWPLVVLLLLALLGFAVAGIVRGGPGRARLSWVLRVVMVVLLIAIALRPQLPGSGRGPSAVGGLEVYFAVDTTSSMAAEDFEGTNTRLSAAKADIAGIVAALPGAQYSLVSFDAAATQRVPLTTDATAIDSAASVLTQEITIYSHGSSIDEAVPLLKQILTAAKTKNPKDRRVLFYLGDGEQTIATAPGSFASLAPLISGGGVLGYGTAAGGRMKQFDGLGKHSQAPSYIQDDTQQTPTDAISHIDETALRLIAKQLGVSYTHRTDSGGVPALVSGLDVGTLAVDPGKPGGPIELYWIFAIPLGLLVIYELVRLTGTVVEATRRNPKRQRREGDEG